MEIRRTEPSRTFCANYGGAGLNFQHRCGHGQPTISLHLFREHDGVNDDIGVLLPTCFAPDLFGAAIAYYEAAAGREAADDFVEQMNKARDKAAQILAAEQAEHAAVKNACCEAGFRTNGREHTCRPDTTPPA